MMTPERWTQIKEIFAVVVEQPLDTRQTTVRELCHGDRELQSEIEQLISQHEEMGGFLEGATSANPKNQFQPGDLLATRYQIIEMLGSGGMGEVYEAEDIELGERVAVKVIRQEASFGQDLLDRLRREVQLARRVTHPNVCRVFDLGHDCRPKGEIIFLTMELLKGETLSARLKREGKMAPAAALAVALQLCAALDAAHRARVLHRDFKCSNVMLSGSGEQLRTVVTDFGIARWIQTGEDRQHTATSHGMVLGTPAYMSPEQLLGEDLTAASDIYSLGLVLYEMVTGDRPFRDESSWTETLKRLAKSPLPPTRVVPELDEHWNSTILRCLEREPAKRFSSAADVTDALLGHKTFLLSRLSRPAMASIAFSIVVLLAAVFIFRNRIWPPYLPEQKHIAVLPFVSKGTDPATQATAYELAESLTGNLARLQTLERSIWVVPWSEVRNQKPEDAGRAAPLLGVNLLITGELQQDAGRLRLHTELKDASSLKELRSQNIEIPAAEVVDLEDTLLKRVSGMLQVSLPAEAQHRLPADEAVEPGAYQFYQQGRGYLLHFSPATPEDLDRSITLLQKAIEKDSNFALAYANLASAYAAKFHSTQDLRWLEKAKQVCDRALSLNGKLAYAHLALGSIHQETGDMEGAIQEFEKTLQLDRTDEATLRRLSRAYESSGRLLQAEALLKDALKHTPGNWLNYNNLAAFYYRNGQYGQAEPLFRTATELAPDNSLAFYNLGGVYLAQGKYKEAETILARAIAIKPSAGGYSNLATVRQYQGHYADAAAMFQKATELLPEDDRLWFNLGNAYSLAGNKSKATEAYEKAVRLAERAAALRPKDAPLLCRLALYNAKLGQRARAQEEVTQATRWSQSDPELLFNSGLVYELLGDREHALAALRSALRAGWSVSEIQNAPELTQLRADKRFIKMIGSPGS